MKRSAIDPMPDHFGKYIMLVDDIDLKEALDKSLEQLDHINLKPLEELGDKVYAPGKWTVADIFQHMIDSERVFAYRALRFARNDATPLQGFDQNLYAKNIQPAHRSLSDFWNEFKLVRQSNIMLFDGFDDMVLQRRGIASGTDISVLALGFTLIGHQIHHLRIIDEKYLPLAT